MSGPAPALIIASPSDLRRARSLCADVAVEWCYLGTNRARRAAVARRLAASARWVDIGPELTRVAHAAKGPFLDWLADIERQQRQPVTWWASTLASPSPLETDIFLLVCYTRLLEHWRRATGSPPRLVIVEDPWLLLTLRRHFAGEARVVFVGSGRLGCLVDALRWCARIPRVAVGNVRRIASWWWAGTLARRHTVEEPPVGRRLVLIHTWVALPCFSGGRAADPWTGRLDRLLRDAGLSVARLSPLNLPPRLARRLGQFGVPWIVAPQHVRVTDTLRALSQGCRIDGLWRLARCEGWDYRPLVVRSLLREWGEGHFTHYLCSYFTMRRIARRWGPRVASVVYPFENQPWEKLFCLAWRAEAPHVRLIGYQHSWVPPLLVQYALGRGQAERVPLPDSIVANSDWNLARLRAGGFPESRLVSGGALRYEHLGQDDPACGEAPQGHTAGSPREKTVLVALPLSAAYAAHLLTDLVEAVEQPLIITPHGRPVSFVVKCHPSLPVARLGVNPKALPPWVQLSQEPLAWLLPTAAMCLYVGPTASAWEALASGIPVLAYQTDLLDLDADWGADGVQVPRCSRATLRAALEAMLRDRAGYRRPAHHVVQHLFGRVEETVWVTLAGGGQDVAKSPQTMVLA